MVKFKLKDDTFGDRYTYINALYVATLIQDVKWLDGEWVTDHDTTKIIMSDSREYTIGISLDEVHSMLFSESAPYVPKGIGVSSR